MVNVLGLMDILSTLDSIDLNVSPSRCIRVRNNKASCNHCIDACTSKAIKAFENELIIVPDLCIGCGSCATMCPTAALEARNPDDKKIVECSATIVQEYGLPLTFACSEFARQSKSDFDKRRVIQVACLGRLDETILMTLISAGINELTFVAARCEQCPNKASGSTIDSVRLSVEALLAAWGLQNAITVTHELPADLCITADSATTTEDATGVSRREFFAQFKTGAKSLAVGAAANIVGVADAATVEQAELTKVGTDGTLPHFVPHRRETLLNCLSLIGDPITQQLNTRLWGDLEIDAELCDSCRMCATFCPTGAISKFDAADGSIGIDHYSAHCVQCRLCEDVCRANALKISSLVNLDYFVNGQSKRFAMEPLTRIIGKPNSMYKTMYDMLGGGQIFER